MFRLSCRGIKVLAVLCVTALWFVYSLQQSSLKNSEDSGENFKPDLRTSPATKKENTTSHVLISLVNLNQHPKIVRDFRVCLSSICKHSSIAITLHVVTDNRSQVQADRVIGELKKELCKDKVYVQYHDIGFVARELEPLMKVFTDLFSSNPKSYFSGALFFLSIISHILFPHNSKLIILDADLKFQTDIRKLWDKFEDFSPNNIIGIAHELQPVYKHITWQYRQAHPDTKIGAPLPNGKPGFNSGVLLMDLQKIRKSGLYKEYLADPTRLRQLTEKYFFKGHLGDQCFYTLLSFEHQELFYVLPCTWNRQLCTYWKKGGYEEVFHSYYNCEGYVNVYHGNCGTAIPDS